mmetsp:Transcript_88992/g.197730  ORF Transcript_88992/g.197730 Transcript_88992/m.197730 type:complete len:257 (-) Transcript_88992:1252-2022(-)
MSPWLRLCMRAVAAAECGDVKASGMGSLLARWGRGAGPVPWWRPVTVSEAPRANLRACARPRALVKPISARRRLSSASSLGKSPASRPALRKRTSNSLTLLSPPARSAVRPAMEPSTTSPPATLAGRAGSGDLAKFLGGAMPAAAFMLSLGEAAEVAVSLFLKWLLLRCSSMPAAVFLLSLGDAAAVAAAAVDGDVSPKRLGASTSTTGESSFCGEATLCNRDEPFGEETLFSKDVPFGEVGSCSKEVPFGDVPAL